MELLVAVAGNIALLIWGLHMTRTGLLRGYGALLRSTAQNVADRRLAAFGFGVVAAALMQSSMAVITIGATLSGRRLLTPALVLAIALGADLGSALAAQLLGYPVGWLSPLFVALGVVLFESSRRDDWRNLGRANIGVGLVLLSLTLMKQSFAPMAGSSELASAIAVLSDQPALLVLLATVLTLATHSGLAVIAIVVALAHNGVIGAEPSLFMVLGANLGSGLAALLATRRYPAPMRIAPIANLAVRGLGVVLVFPLLLLLPLEPLAEGTLILAAHLGFNAILAFSALPLVGPLVGLIERMLPISATDPALAPLHLDQGQLGRDDLALASARRETVRIADRVQSMLADAGLALRGTDPALVQPILEAEDQVDLLYAAVKDYCTEFLRRNGPSDQSQQMLATLEFATELEHIGDVIVHNLVSIATRKNKHRRSFSEAGLAEIMALHALVSDNMKLATTAFLTADGRLAEEIIATKPKVHRSVLMSTDAHFRRIVERSAGALSTSGLHLDILRDLKRINSHLVAACHLTRNGQRIDAMASVDASGQK
jgi:phosphate:Na+ symporter